MASFTHCEYYKIMIDDRDIEDIESFADPYTGVKRKRMTAGCIRLNMIRGGRDLSLEFKEDGVVEELVGRKARYPSVNSLLASERFANLSQFVSTQLRASALIKVGNIIPSSIEVSNRALTTEDFVNEFNSKNDKKKLKLFLLEGPAGVGKTFQINALVEYFAKKASGSEAIAPILHLTSKGRRLSNLRDALAAATQDINASFFARHVPILVRRGLLTVAIDGFDELVDADGYEDSWLALRQFIEEVGCGGTMLLAARDTFIEEQDLLTRIEKSRDEVELTVGRVLTPNAMEAKEWLEKSPNWKPSELDSEISEDLLRDESYVLRPFFLRELWTAKGWSEVADTGPRTFIVNRLVGREARLISQQIGGVTVEVVAEVLLQLLEEVAVEMAGREVDSVEIEHLSFLTEYIFEGVLDVQSIRKLMHKSGSLALLELTSDKRARRFPHSEVRHYFLGQAVRRALAQGGVPAFLRRYVFNCEELEVFAEVFSNKSKENNAASNKASVLLSSEISGDSLATNLSALLFIMLSLGYCDRIDYAETIEATFAGLTPVGTISNSKVNRLDACGADISEVTFYQVEVDTLVVDEGTLMGSSMPNIKTLEVIGRDGTQPVRGKSEIASWISLRTRMDGAANTAEVKLLEKVARRSIKQFYLRVAGGENDGAELLNDPLWSFVSKVLSRHGRLEVRRAKPMHGRPSPLIRIKNPLALLDSLNKETQEIWSELLSEKKTSRTRREVR